MTAAPLDLDALEAAEKAATRAPWNCATAGTFATAYAPPDKQGMEWPVARMREPSDGGFIVSLRNAAPALFAAARERDELREALEAAERALEPFAVFSESDTVCSETEEDPAWRGEWFRHDGSVLMLNDFRNSRAALAKARAALGLSSAPGASAPSLRSPDPDH